MCKIIWAGEIIRFESTSGDHTEKHYANLISGALVDTTRSQFTADTSLKESPPDLHGFKNLRERMLSDASTAERYKYLKSKVEQILAA